MHQVARVTSSEMLQTGTVVNLLLYCSDVGLNIYICHIYLQTDPLQRNFFVEQNAQKPKEGPLDEKYMCLKNVLIIGWEYL